jgi:hypothetical protein
MWGSNQYGQLARPGGDSAVPVRSPLDAPFQQHPVVELALGGGHSLARDSQGQVWAWGWNAKGQLGLPMADEVDGCAQSYTPSMVPGLAPCRRVAAGHETSFAISIHGELFAFGAARGGAVVPGSRALGGGGREGGGMGVKVHRLSDALCAAVGVGEGREGVGKREELGRRKGGEGGEGGERAEGRMRFVDVAAGVFHAAAVTESGECLVWGKYTSTPSPPLPPTSSPSAHTHQTLSPSVPLPAFSPTPTASTTSSAARGGSEGGQRGGGGGSGVAMKEGGQRDGGGGVGVVMTEGGVGVVMTERMGVLKWWPADGASIVEVACGWRHTVARDSRGRVWGLGSNGRGQLEPPEQTPSELVDFPPPSPSKHTHTPSEFVDFVAPDLGIGGAGREGGGLGEGEGEAGGGRGGGIRDNRSDGFGGGQGKVCGGGVEDSGGGVDGACLVCVAGVGGVVELRVPTLLRLCAATKVSICLSVRPSICVCVCVCVSLAFYLSPFLTSAPRPPALPLSLPLSLSPSLCLRLSTDSQHK